MSIIFRGLGETREVVEGKLQKPTPLSENASQQEKLDYEQKSKKYNEVDSMAMIVMANNMSEEIFEQVKDAGDAHSMWRELKLLFEVAREEKAYDMCMKFFCYTKKDSDDMATHITKLKNLWKELSQELEKSENKDLLLMFRILETLPEKYFSFVSSWKLLNKEQRNIDSLTTQLCSFERSINEKVELKNETYFCNKVEQRNSRDTVSKCFNCNRTGHIMKNCRELTKVEQRNINKGTTSKGNSVSKIRCFHCNETGHTKKNCRKLKAEQSERNSNSADSMHAIEVNVLDSHNSRDAWFVDNGATRHLTFRRDFLKNYIEFQVPKKLQLANGGTVEVLGKGSVEIKSNVYNKVIPLDLHEVWFVPEIKKNLFSVLAAHERRKNSTFMSSVNKCSVKIDNRLVLLGTREEGSGLFKLLVKTNSQGSNDESNVVDDCSKIQLYHERFAHQNKKHVKSFLRNLSRCILP